MSTQLESDVERARIARVAQQAALEMARATAQRATEDAARRAAVSASKTYPTGVGYGTTPRIEAPTEPKVVTKPVTLQEKQQAAVLSRQAQLAEAQRQTEGLAWTSERQQMNLDKAKTIIDTAESKFNTQTSIIQDLGSHLEEWEGYKDTGIPEVDYPAYQNLFNKYQEAYDQYMKDYAEYASALETYNAYVTPSKETRSKYEEAYRKYLAEYESAKEMTKAYNKAVERDKKEQMKKYGFKGTWEEFVKEVESQQEAVKWLSDRGVVTIKNDKVTLVKSVDKLSSAERKELKQAGFNVPEVTAGVTEAKKIMLKSFIPKALQPKLETSGILGELNVISTVKQFLSGFVAVPTATFVSPLTRTPAPATPSAGLIGLVPIGRRSPAWEAKREESIARGEETRKQLAELGSAYLAGGILGEVAQAIVLSKIAGEVSTKVSTAIGKAAEHLPYTWRVRLGVTPNPTITLEQVSGIESPTASETFKIVTSQKGVWGTIQPTIGETPISVDFPLKFIRGQVSTPLSGLSQVALQLNRQQQAALQVVLQKEATILAKALSEAAIIKTLPASLITAMSLEPLSGELTSQPPPKSKLQPFPGMTKQVVEDVEYVYYIKPGEVANLEKTISLSVQEIIASISLLKTPTVETFMEQLPRLSTGTLNVLIPVIDQKVLLRTIPILDVATLTRVVPLVSDAQISSLIPNLEQSAILRVIPSLTQSQLQKVIPMLTTLQLSELLLVPPPRYIPPLLRRRIQDLVKNAKKIIPTRFLEPYKVTFGYYMDSESFKVKARSFREALVIGFNLKKKRDAPEGVEVKKLGKGERRN